MGLSLSADARGLGFRVLVLECEFDKESCRLESLRARMENACGHIENNFLLESVVNIPQISAFREAVSNGGKNPNRHRISSEALFRRICQGKGIYFINPIVDLNNYMCLYSFLPVGSYESSSIRSGLHLRMGLEGEVVSTISKGDFDMSNSVVLADDAGIVGSPINDSKRCMINAETARFYMVFYSASKVEVDKIINEFEITAPIAGVSKISHELFE